LKVLAPATTTQGGCAEASVKVASNAAVSSRGSRLSSVGAGARA
jgi:hypothetical protein